MWKYTKVICVNPHRRKYAFPHVEVSHEIVHFRMWKYTKNCEFPNVRKYSFLVYFDMRKFERESEFLHVNLKVDSWISGRYKNEQYLVYYRMR